MARTDDRLERDRTTVDTAWNTMSRLIAGMVLYGGIGWLLGLWLGNPRAFAAIGLVVGMALSLYLVHVRLSAASGERQTPDSK